VDAAFEQALRLFAEDGPRLCKRSRAVRLDPDAERTHRARYQCATPRRRARQRRRTRVQLADLRLESVLRQLHAVRTEAVRLQQLRASLDVRGVDVPDEVRLLQVQLVVTAVDEDALLVEHRAHCA